MSGETVCCVTTWVLALIFKYRIRILGRDRGWRRIVEGFIGASRLHARKVGQAEVIICVRVRNLRLRLELDLRNSGVIVRVISRNFSSFGAIGLPARARLSGCARL